MATQSLPLHPLFGAELRGLGAGAPDEAAAQAFEAAVGQFGLVLVRGVVWDDAALARFAGMLGPLQDLSPPPNVRKVIPVTNLDAEGRLKTADDPARVQHDTNFLWHADSSFMTPGASYSFLHARIVPAEGGDTEFLDTRVAFEALEPERQQALRPLKAVHSIRHSWKLVGIELDHYPVASIAPVRRNLVRRHAPSGREALAIPSHVEQLEGLGYAESQALIAKLLAVAAAPERVHRHRWAVGDLLVWDNRCMLHRVTAYRAFEAPRDLRSCRVVDVGDEDGERLAESA
jgi:alpha-ketoglutarate-dependent 2,4-dichlorophenoxyacetate dioxygenase